MTIEELRDKLRTFVKERDWSQYHDPKNLATGLSIEASELLEIFLWTRTENAHQHGSEMKSRVEEELGDVLLYCVMLADSLGIDPLEAAASKLELNAKKYPVELARGKSDKYDALKGNAAGSDPD